MPSRHSVLRETFEGYKATGVPLVAQSDSGFAASGTSDDIGLYLTVPAIARRLGINIEPAVSLLLGTAAIVGSLSGIIGFFFLFRNRMVRLLSTGVVIALSAVTLKLGDVYVFEFVAAVGLVPWILYAEKQRRFSWPFLLFATVLGIVVGFCNLMRSHSATPAVIFIGILTALHAFWSWRAKVVTLTVLVAGLLLPNIFLMRAINKRGAFMQKQYSDYVAPINRHVFWHSIYVGLGFLSNPYIAGFCDQVSFDKAATIAPGAQSGSAENEIALRRASFRFALDHPALFAMNCAAKFGVILVAFLISANVGLLAAIVHPKRLSIEAACWTSLSFAALPGILVVPIPKYLLGFVSLAAIYGIISMEHALQSRATLRSLSVHQLSSLSCEPR